MVIFKKKKSLKVKRYEGRKIEKRRSGEFFSNAQVGKKRPVEKVRLLQEKQ